jgi:protein-S-isoprenylcysteine O-methyltransferase Ste14
VTSPSTRRHVLAVLLLPGLVTVGVPALIAWRTGADAAFGLDAALAAPLVTVGALLVLGGLLLVGRTLALFAREGEGTLAPWDETRRLVVQGPYRRVRNPMLSGVCAILLGEALVLGSIPLLLWFGGVVLVNVLYMPLVEEPGLRRRFGEEYDVYRANVPRWIPRLRPWRQLEPARAQPSTSSVSPPRT